MRAAHRVAAPHDARLRAASLAWLRLRREVKSRLGWLEPLRLDVYGGYAGPERAFVWGRALENEVPAGPEPRDTWADNLRRSLRQLRTDEVPGLSVRVSLGESQLELETDDGGYFCAELPVCEPSNPGSAPVLVEVTDRSIELAAGVAGQGELLVPPPEARFGVISDVDDTILQSHVQNRLKQAYLTLFGNAITRLSYEDTADLYGALREAGRGAPFFYVSRSAWNIHALLEHFIRHQNLPQGPLILRDVKLFNRPEQRRGHKRREIERILATYPGLRFVLVGDSGQADAFIYADVARAHPGRVLAILIRNVSSAGRRQKLLAELRSRCPDVPCLIFDHALEAKRYCQQLGLCCRSE